MVKTEKKKYTKKNITNKIHKSKKNSGTAKKKAFRKSKKSKKEEGGGIFTNKNIHRSEKRIIKGNEMLRKEFLILEKQPPTLINIRNMESIKEMISENNRMLRRIYNEGKSNYVDLEGVIDLSLLKIPEQATTTSSSSLKETNNKKPTQLDPLPECWEQKFENFERVYIRKGTGKRRDKNNRPPPDYDCHGDEKEASNNTSSTTFRSSNNSKRSSKRSSNGNVFETLLERSNRFKKEAAERQKERASLEQRIKKAKAEAEAAKAERLEIEKAAKAERLKLEKAAKEKEEKEDEINATWRDVEDDK